MIRRVLAVHVDGGTPFEHLAEVLIRRYTAPNELVLDPFAGSGTTIAVARRLGRRGLGVEIVPEFASRIAAGLGADAVIEGYARRIETLGLPPVDLVMTSPPFMTVTNHPQNPLSGYQTLDGDYATYLDTLESIAGSLQRLIRPGGILVLNLWNFHHEGLFTPLADDVEARLTDILVLQERVRLVWDDATDAPDEDVCLIYQVPR